MLRWLTVACLVLGLSLPAHAGILEPALRLALWSAIATDRYQTEQWVDYTRERPLTLSWELPAAGGGGTYAVHCACVYEANPVLAGQREKMHPYFDWWSTAVGAAPLERWSPLAKAGVALFAANWLHAVIENNRKPLEITGRPTPTGPPLHRYAVIEYRLAF